MTLMVRTLQPYANVGLIIAMYNPTFVRFEKSFDLKNFKNIKKALFAFTMLLSHKNIPYSETHFGTDSLQLSHKIMFLQYSTLFKC